MSKPGIRLTPSQLKVLNAVTRQGYISVASIAESCDMTYYVCQHTLDALTRRSLVSPVDLISGIGYVPMPRAKRTLEAQ